MHGLNGQSENISGASLEVYLLGLVDYDSARVLQDRLVYELSGREDTQGALLVCEHPPLITVGREGSSAHILCESDELRARHMEIQWVNRGGGCFVHVPGQLAIYPILPLQRKGIGLDTLRDVVENATISLCSDMKVQARRNREIPGVWGRTGQLAHFGMAVKSWVSYHGLFLNVSPSLDWMRLVSSNPESRTSSLTVERQRAVAMSSVREGMIRRLAAGLNYQRFHLYSGHPLLHRTKKVFAYA